MIKTYIKTESGSLVPVNGVYGGQRKMGGSIRNSLEIRLNGDYEVIKNVFADDLSFCVVQKNDENGFEEEFSKDTFCVAGDIVDHRDGSFTVYMGEKTDEELLREENAALLYQMLVGEEFE